MLCIISFIFLFVIVSQLEAGDIALGQAIFYSIYGIIMFYYTSKPFWNYDKHTKNRRNY